MDSGDSDVVNARDRGAQRLGGDGGLFSNRCVRRAGGHHRDLARSRAARSDFEDSRLRMVVAAGILPRQGFSLFWAEAGDEDRLLSTLQCFDQTDQLLHRLALAENDLRKTKPKMPVGVERREAKLGERKVLQALERSAHWNFLRPYLSEQTPKLVLVHASLEPQFAQQRSEASAFRHQNQLPA